MRHTYSATWTVRSAAEAELWAHESCTAYFGEQPYTVSISTDEQRTLDGTVRGYRVTLDAEAIGPDHPALSILNKISQDPGGHVTDLHIDVTVSLTDDEISYLRSLEPAEWWTIPLTDANGRLRYG